MPVKNRQKEPRGRVPFRCDPNDAADATDATAAEAKANVSSSLPSSRTSLSGFSDLIQLF